MEKREVVKIELNNRCDEEFVFEVTWDDGSTGLIVVTVPMGPINVTYVNCK